MPFLMETDFLLALISKGDKHHDEVVELLDRFVGEFFLSPYSLIELDLLLKSGEIAVTGFKDFYILIGRVLKFRRIGSLPIKPSYQGEAWSLRDQYKWLTYFDSLHAAVAVTENLELISYDKKYRKVKELTYNHPSKYLREKSNRPSGL